MSIQYKITSDEDIVEVSIKLYPEHLVDLLGDLAYIEELELQHTGTWWKKLRTDLGKVELRLSRDLDNVPYLQFEPVEIINVT